MSKITAANNVWRSSRINKEHATYFEYHTYNNHKIYCISKGLKKMIAYLHIKSGLYIINKIHFLYARVNIYARNM